LWDLFGLKIVPNIVIFAVGMSVVVSDGFLGGPKPQSTG